MVKDNSAVFYSEMIMGNEETVRKIFLKALESVGPSSLVKGYAEKIHSYYSGKDLSGLVVIGFGKASFQMAKAVEDMIDNDLITGGIVVTKYGHALSQESEALKKIKIYEAGHPVPDDNGITATEEIISLLKNTDKNTLVLCLVSGGGSALFVSPYEGMTLGEKQLITNLLLKSGADITELNTVRKHLSRVKGGRLAEIAYPSEIISLMISDVVGDALDVIASGPTAPDTSTFRDALGVIDKYGLRKKAPESVIDILERGRGGSIQETPKQDDRIFANVTNIIIGSNRKALEAARNEAYARRFETEIISSEITGEAKDVGKWLAGKAKEAKAQRHKGAKCFISGGETTVTVRGEGKGGRNTELALSFAMEIEGVEGITLLSAGTDGNDGPTDAAGAVVDGETIKKAKGIGLNPQEYLDNNDSYNFFKKINSLLITGPTGTNVMDIQIVVAE